MNPKASVYIATSLDGFIAGKNGNLDWLDEANAGIPKGEDCGFDKFMSSVDALVMGRKTYEKVRSFGQWPYGETPVIVQSSRAIKFPPGTPDTVSYSSESPVGLMRRLADEGVGHVYVDGGITIQSFLRAGLINEITLTVIPTILGEGIPLFGVMDRPVKLTHLETISYEFGLVQSKYVLNH